MHVRPILSALRRHRLATVLIVLQVALASAVLTNACFLIAQRVAHIHARSGVDLDRLAQVSITGYDTTQAADVNARMLHALRGIPGVQSVSLINAVPFGAPAGNAGVLVGQDRKRFGGVVHLYVGGPGSFEALGLKLVDGRVPHTPDFQPVPDFVPSQAVAVITQSLARHWWPDQSPLGKVFWMDKDRLQIVGVVQRMLRPNPFGSASWKPQWSVFVPGLPGPGLSGNYLLRAPAGQLDRIMRDARKAVAGMAPEVVLDRDQTATVATLRQKYFQTDRSMIGLLVGVIAALLLVTALGIVGLASFWVGQRRKQIGVRRALGATRGDILRYFQTENFLIVTFGIALGVVMAYGLNLLLMQHYELPRLPFGYLPIGALALWLLGQLAVLSPALRASSVPPVVATRSV